MTAPSHLLIAALIAARKQVSPTVHKSGNNSAQGYKYVGHEHVLVGGARQALLDNGLVLEQQTVELIGTIDRGQKDPFLRWKGTHALLHESGESRTYVFEATTISNDKSAFVASTALDRTAHMRVLELAGSAEENPEHDSNSRERFEQKREERRQAQASRSAGHDNRPLEGNRGDSERSAATQRSERTHQQNGTRSPTTATGAASSAPSHDEYGIPVPRTPCPVFGQRTPETLRGKRWDAKEGGWLIQQWYESDLRAQMTPAHIEWAEYCIARRKHRHELEEAEQAEHALNNGSAAPAAGG